MILEDYHLHTTFCDGKNTPEQMVQAAINMGLRRLGITVHSFTDFDTEYCIALNRIDEYKDEIARLKEKYKDKIEIFCGIEQDIYTTIKPDGYDYIIGSVHYVKKNNEYITVDLEKELLKEKIALHYNGDFYAFCEDYYALVASIADTNANIIGHFDLITKLNGTGDLFDQTNERYLAAAKAAADVLLKTNKVFEVNTGGISRGYIDHPYPDIPLLKYIAKNGGKFVLTSDAHSCENLCFQFDKWSKVLDEIIKIS